MIYIYLNLMRSYYNVFIIKILELFWQKYFDQFIFKSLIKILKSQKWKSKKTKKKKCKICLRTKVKSASKMKIEISKKS